MALELKSRTRLTVVSIISIAALLFLAFSAWRSRPRVPRTVIADSSGDSAADSRATPTEVEAIWSAGPFRALESTPLPELRANIRSAMYGDVSEVPSDRMDLLTEIIAKHLSARAAPTADEYLRLIENDPNTRWVDRSDRWFAELEYQWQWNSGELGQEVFDDPARRARWLIEFYRENREARPAESRLEHVDVMVRAGRIRSEDALAHALWSDTPRSEHQRWIRGAGGQAVRLRVAKRPIGNVLSDYGQVSVVETSMVLRSVGGHLTVWQGIWFWDPAIGTWSNHLMGRRAVTNPGYTGTYY